MLTLTQRLPPDPQVVVSLTLPLTADDRIQSRQNLTLPNGQLVALRLPRGTTLRDGDLLRTEATSSSEHSGILVRVIAKPEPVLTVTAHSPFELLRAAYHLGNRHVPLEIQPTYLRLSPDPVLKAMLEQLGLHILEETQPFQPETGAYGGPGGQGSHSHNHHKSGE
ncbi:MAG: urease accessory protein UreE [Leptolyngbyaceae cyanobacterium bins.59]|nr:urease accessory protein UreE [Leptolyngbyaceae cyanobacterium bins.59]